MTSSENTERLIGANPQGDADCRHDGSPQPYLGYFPDAELVFGIVCPLGTPYQHVAETLSNYLSHFGYQPNPIKLSSFFADLLTKLKSPLKAQGADRTSQSKFKIAAGNEIRARTHEAGVLALVAAGAIAQKRIESKEPDPQLSLDFSPEDQTPNLDDPKWEGVYLPRTAHIICTLKRPEEVDYLRRIYGTGFFLIGVSSSKAQRHEYFKEIGVAEEEIDGLITTDADEQKSCGQQTRETFYLADVFVSMDDYGNQIIRFLELLFGCPFLTPTAEEHGMFLAYAASLRSGDLSRQVGAAIVDSNGDLLSVGCNEVPKFGGGIYGPEKGSQRDIEKGFDSNERQKFEMAEKIANVFGNTNRDHASLKKLLKPTGFFDITEFGRSVHAEMEALLACARSGRSPRGATLFTTTFPCHNCTRHIIDAGVMRVCYIEPYAKSKAPELHDDAICIDETIYERLPFMAFVGVGPRRYFDLFSLKLSSGYAIERKADGVKRNWERTDAPLRLQLQPTFYLRREILAWKALEKLLG